MLKQNRLLIENPIVSENNSDIMIKTKRKLIKSSLSPSIMFVTLGTFHGALNPSPSKIPDSLSSSGALIFRQVIHA